jgi:hypothetical protein
MASILEVWIDSFIGEEDTFLLAVERRSERVD